MANLAPARSLVTPNGDGSPLIDGMLEVRFSCEKRSKDAPPVVWSVGRRAGLLPPEKPACRHGRADESARQSNEDARGDVIVARR